VADVLRGALVLVLVPTLLAACDLAEQPIPATAPAEAAGTATVAVLVTSPTPSAGGARATVTPYGLQSTPRPTP